MHGHGLLDFQKYVGAFPSLCSELNCPAFPFKLFGWSIVFPTLSQAVSTLNTSRQISANALTPEALNTVQVLRQVKETWSEMKLFEWGVLENHETSQIIIVLWERAPASFCSVRYQECKILFFKATTELGSGDGMRVRGATLTDSPIFLE